MAGRKHWTILSIVVGAGVAAVLLWPRTANRGPSVRPPDAGTPGATGAHSGASAGRPGASAATSAAPIAPLAPSTIRLRARWGSSPGELARKQDPDGNPEAPMSFVAGKNGDTWVLDQANLRVQHFDRDGKVIGQVRLDGDAVQEIAVGQKGELFALDRLGHKEIAVYDANGELVSRTPVVGGPISEGGMVTGMFPDGSELWLEREHTDSVRVIGPDGAADATRQILPGRPSRDGGSLVKASVVSRGGTQVNVFAYDRDAPAKPRWQRTLVLPRGLVYLLLLDTDLRGHLYVGARVGNDAPEPPYGLVDEATIVVRLDLATGADAGALTLPAYTGADEMFRELAVSDDGEVAQMLPSADGVVISTYRFP